MFAVGYQSVAVPAQEAAKDLVFELDTGDFGKKRFAATHLKPNGTSLTMTYAGTPFRELNGRPFTYERQ